MVDFITLIGAEDVRRAGANMLNAAERIQSATSGLLEAITSLTAAIENSTIELNRLSEEMQRYYKLLPEKEKRKNG